MRKLLLAIALLAAAPAFSADECPQNLLPPISQSDSIQSIRAKLLLSGLFPIYTSKADFDNQSGLHNDPKSAANKLRKLGFFEFNYCVESTAFKGCSSTWLTRSNEQLEISFPASDFRPFVSNCPRQMRN